MSTFTDDIAMIDQLKNLGFSEKEAKVYLALLEFGTQPASVIAKKTSLPKATVLFLFDNLFKKNYIKRSQKGRVLYFYADPEDLQNEKNKELKTQTDSLQKTIPLLKEFKNPFTSPPKILFFEGLDGCRKAYMMLTQSKTPVLEFAAHNDLEKMGYDFMQTFIKTRVKNKVHIHAIAKKDKTHLFFNKLNKKQLRKLSLFDDKIGTFYSSISVFEDKVLLLNLYQDCFAILIQNKEVAETLKTIHALAW